MASYELSRKRLEDLERDAQAALTGLHSVLAIFTEYQVKKLSGIELAFKKTATPVGTVKPVDSAIVEIKTKIKVLSTRYFKIFPDEFKFLDEKKLQDFQCLPTASIFGSVELKTAVNKVAQAMNTKLKSIQSAKKEINKKASEGPAKSKALAAFFSLANNSLLDSITTEESIVRDFERDMAEKDYTIENDTNDGVQASVNGTSSTLKGLWDILGLESVPAVSVAKKVEDFQEYLRTLQYPKSLRYCDANRNPLSRNSLQDSRNNNAEQNSAQEKEANLQEDRQSQGFGRAYLKKPEFIRTDRLAKFRLSITIPLSRQQEYQARYNNLVSSVAASNTKTAVRGYVAEINKLLNELR